MSSLTLPYRNLVMKKTSKLLAILALLLATFVHPSAANAGGCQSFSFRGPSVRADFYNGLSCVISDIFVIATDARLREEPGPAQRFSYASVTIFLYDSCTDTRLLYAYGSKSPPPEV